MLQIFFTENNQEWSKGKLDQMLLPLPDAMRNKILTYKGWQDRQSRILGRHLLLKLLDHFGLDLTLADLKYTRFNKPYFGPPNSLKGALTAPDLFVLKPPLGLQSRTPRREGLGVGVFDFSIAHSGSMVICAGMMNAQIGADIEQVVPVELADYEEQLTPHEWRYIHDAPDPLSAFYQVWTKKEALIKALGRGIDLAFDTLDVSRETISYEGSSYRFHPLSPADGYIAHIATSAPFYNGPISSEKL